MDGVDMNCFRLDYRITNISAKEIIVKVKGGLSYIVKRSNQPTYRTEHQVHICIQGVYLENLQVDERAALTKLDKTILVEVSKERARLLEVNEQYHTSMPTDLMVTINLGPSMVERNDAIHSELLGVTMYIGMENLDKPCLNTPGYTLQELFDNYDREAEHSSGMHCFIYMNDPQRVSNTFYTNVMGKSTEVPIDYDKTKQPGLYVGISRGIEPRETQYYTFASLDNAKLEQLGLFKTKAECDKGGNTERFLAAEAKVKDLQKDNGTFKVQLDTLSEALVKAETNNVRLSGELTKVNDTHKTEINQLKLEHRMEANQLKNSGKMTADMFKFESKIKDTVTKANLDIVKQKGAHNSWGDFAKAIGTLAGVAFTGYKLLTSA